MHSGKGKRVSGIEEKSFLVPQQKKNWFRTPGVRSFSKRNGEWVEHNRVFSAGTLFQLLPGLHTFSRRLTKFNQILVVRIWFFSSYVSKYKRRFGSKLALLLMNSHSLWHQKRLATLLWCHQKVKYYIEASKRLTALLWHHQKVHYLIMMSSKG